MYVRVPMTLRVTLRNPTRKIIQLQALLNSSDSFMFSGHRQVNEVSFSNWFHKTHTHIIHLHSWTLPYLPFRRTTCCSIYIPWRRAGNRCLSCNSTMSAKRPQQQQQQRPQSTVDHNPGRELRFQGWWSTPVMPRLAILSHPVSIRLIRPAATVWRQNGKPSWTHWSNGGCPKWFSFM